jgi:tetratricopeptide (TPR) repeat protein
VVSDVVARLVEEDFELASRPARDVKGVPDPVAHWVVAGERAERRTPSVDPRTPVIGRGPELDRLQACWGQACAGSLAPPGIALRGESGIGKSRVATSIVEQVQAAGHVVLELFGSPFHVDAGLHPVRVLLERRAGITRTASATERLQCLADEVQTCGLDPAATVPLLAPVLGIEPGAGYEPTAADGRRLHDQILAGVESYLLACLGSGPSLVLVEDFQWLDDATQELVRRLLATGRADVMVLITARSGVASPGGSQVEVLDLAPFTAPEIEALIAALDDTLPIERREAVARRCDGIPLYVEHLVSGLRSDHPPGDVRPMPPSVPADRRADAEPISVPEALYEPLLARLSRSATAMPVAAAAATIGRVVDRRLLEAVVSLDGDELDAAIDELGDAMVLEAVQDDFVWRFRHELLREVAYELQPPSVRRSLHGRVADALVTDGPGEVRDWRVVAGHFDRAGRHDEAAAAYEKAGDGARQLGALAEARALLARAIEQISLADPTPTRDRREVGMRLARGFLAVAAEGNSSADAASDFERCLELSGTDVHADELFSTFVALWGYYASRADLDRAVQVLEWLRIALGAGREFFKPENDAGFGMIAWFRGDFASARDQLERATAEAITMGPRRGVEAVWFMPTEPVASMHAHLALARFVAGDVAGAEDEIDAATRRADALGFPQGPFSLAYARSLEIWMRIELGDLDRAATLADELITSADQHGFDSWLLVANTQRATVEALRTLADDSSDAARLGGHVATIANFVDMWRLLEVRAFLTSYYAVLGRLLTAAGQREQARARLDEALQLASDTGMSFYDVELLRLRAHAQDDPALRALDLAAALELACDQGAPVYRLRVACDDVASRGAAAHAGLVAAIGAFPPESGWPELHQARAVLR